jgi:aryl-alcohol dehydrogenase-like predicted oxidoreductase
MFHYLEAGFTTWDLADHYGPAEDFIGEFRRQLAATRGPEALTTMQAFTKWVPQPGPMTRPIVENNVAISLRRMGVETLDLLQFHWWDYNNPAYMDALRHLSDLQEAGKIQHLALTNFDTERLRLIIEGGIKIVSNQVQFSLVDTRPAQKMIPFCQQHGISLLTYGTYCGGLLSEKYLGASEPSYGQLGTASLRKYMGMIDAWGGWGLFQELLTALKQVADKHSLSIATVAVRYILDQPAVGEIAGSDHQVGLARLRGDRSDRRAQHRLGVDHAISLLAGRPDVHVGDLGDECHGSLMAGRAALQCRSYGVDAKH